MTARVARGADAPLVEPARAKRFGRLLRRWFRANGRDLPWRRTRDPYRILVSELMLQQTQVSRVVSYYDAFLTTFPTLHDVARARPKRVMEAWAGLGYYARARNLHALARHVTDRGRDTTATLPAEAEALRALIEKHVEYTGSEHAKAILAAWPTKLPKFARVIPKDYKRALACLKRAHDQGLSGDEAIMAAFEENARDLARVGGN